MARRRRSGWQRVITKLLTAVITDVRADLSAAHKSAASARTVDRSRRGLAPSETREQYAERVTSYGTPATTGGAPRRDQLNAKYRDPKLDDALTPVTQYGTPAPARQARAQRNSGASAVVITDETYNDQYAKMTPAQRQASARKNGLCGAKTRDGSPCMNGAGCSILRHQRNRS